MLNRLSSVITPLLTSLHPLPHHRVPFCTREVADSSQGTASSAQPGPARPRSSAAARRSPALPTGPRRAATSAATILFFTGVKGTRSALIMFPLARAAQSFVGKHGSGSRGVGASSGVSPVCAFPCAGCPSAPTRCAPGTVVRAPQGLRAALASFVSRFFLFISVFF